MTPEWTATVTDPESRKTLTAWVRSVGEDLVVVVGGGERPHVGCVVLAVPVPSRTRPDAWSASCSVITIPPHKEEPIARGMASLEEIGNPLHCSDHSGVHDDDLDRSGVETYLRLGDELADEVARKVAAAATRNNTP